MLTIITDHHSSVSSTGFGKTGFRLIVFVLLRFCPFRSFVSVRSVRFCPFLSVSDRFCPFCTASFLSVPVRFCPFLSVLLRSKTKTIERNPVFPNPVLGTLEWLSAMVVSNGCQQWLSAMGVSNGCQPWLGQELGHELQATKFGTGEALPSWAQLGAGEALPSSWAQL